jgi:hypothetical protein
MPSVLPPCRQFCWVLLMRHRNVAEDVATEWKRHPSPKSSLAPRAPSVSRRFARCSTVNTGVPWEAQEIPLFPCIWPASVYSVSGVVEASVRIFATLAPAAIRSMATDAHRHRYSRSQSDTPEKYSFPRNNLASESPQGGSHNRNPTAGTYGL